MKTLIKTLSIALCITFIFSLCGCGSSGKEKVLIYTSVEDFVLEDMQLALEEKFPDLDITVEYLTTGDHAARLMTEGKNTDCDISYQLEYPYMAKLAKDGVLANLSEIADSSIYLDEIIESEYYVPQYRNGGAIVVNTELLKKKGIEAPKSYQDLLKAEYKDLISMPNPKSSGTGYMYLLNLVNVMGEDEAFSYFDKLSKNIFQFTSSGSGPINALLQGEAAIGLGMTSQAVEKINNEKAPFEIIYFEEGSPYSVYGQGIIEGKQERECVKDVFKYLVGDYGYRVCEKFYPEKIYKDKDFKVENYPENIIYANMSNNTSANKDKLLAKWNH